MKNRTAMNRLVYSTDAGRRCMTCGWPEKECHCSSALSAQSALSRPPETVPAKVTAKLRLENRSSGKSVTVVDGLPNNPAFLESLARELKKACGTGGHTAESSVELQGDQRERLRELLSEKGWAVKG
jgi:translation initiation factor 1